MLRTTSVTQSVKNVKISQQKLVYLPLARTPGKKLLMENLFQPLSTVKSINTFSMEYVSILTKIVELIKKSEVNASLALLALNLAKQALMCVKKLSVLTDMFQTIIETLLK